MLFERIMRKDTSPKGAVSEELLRAVRRYVDAHYEKPMPAGRVGSRPPEDMEAPMPRAAAPMWCGSSEWEEETAAARSAARESQRAEAPKRKPLSAGKKEMDFSFLERLDAGFSETLLQLIDRSGRKDAEVYRKANVDRKLFSKIRTNRDYKPSKATALAFAFALELDLEQTRDLIGRAGFALSHSSKFDVIVEYFLLQGNHDLFELNEVLYAFDQPLLGG